MQGRLYSPCSKCNKKGENIELEAFKEEKIWPNFPKFWLFTRYFSFGTEILIRDSLARRSYERDLLVTGPNLNPIFGSES